MCFYQKAQHDRSAISLIEILIVLSIIGVLIGLLIPAVQMARETARGTSCQSNLHQITVALEQFRAATRKTPKPAQSNAVGGWAIAILPYLEEKVLAGQLEGSPSINQLSILQLIKQRPLVMTCHAAWDGESDIPGIPAAHYESSGLVVSDVPLTSRIPWAESPLLDSNHPLLRGKGPHWRGYYRARYSEDRASGDISWTEGD